jgi:hypothetical protein
MIIILTLLAVARATRLITTDTVFDTPRRWVLTKLVKPGRARALRDKLAYLIVCDWCASVYVGAAAAGAYAAWGETMPFMVVILALAASYAAGFLASVTDRGE